MTEWEKTGELWTPKRNPKTKQFDPVPYATRIWDRQTGERVMTWDRPTWVKEDGHTDEYWWSEGNFSCDCNRGMEFFRAKGFAEESPEILDAPCNFPDRWEGKEYHRRYVIKCVATETGETLYQDDEWVEAVKP